MFLFGISAARGVCATSRWHLMHEFGGFSAILPRSATATWGNWATWKEGSSASSGS
jgi:hypothetical protein